jgi:hypothetical protein
MKTAPSHLSRERFFPENIKIKRNRLANMATPISILFAG